MKNQILFLGSIIFTSHVALGEVLVSLPEPAEVLSQRHVAFEQSISNTLVSRGLETHVAKTLAKDSVEDLLSAPLHTQMLSTKLALSKDEIHTYIATQTLFQKRIDLRSHDDVVGMVQKIKGFGSVQKDLEAIQEYIALV